MLELSTKKSKTIKLKVDGEELEIGLPKNKHAIMIERSGDLDTLLKVFDELGLSRSISEELEQEDLIEVFKYIKDQKKR